MEKNKEKKSKRKDPAEEERIKAKNCGNCGKNWGKKKALQLLKHLSAFTEIYPRRKIACSVIVNLKLEVFVQYDLEQLGIFPLRKKKKKLLANH